LHSYNNRAPISKVIGYLPSNIPRILINRTIVHPKHSSDEDNLHESEFRDGYVFDAYLLGYCDEVTRVLEKLLFPASVTQMRIGSEAPEKTKNVCKLLATLQDGDDEFSASDWKAATKVPFERVFLFPGAQTPVKDDISYGRSFEEPACREVVFCDGCAKKVIGTVQKCVLCFDYDLCQGCYPALSKTHYDGKHQFVAEFTAGEKD
jgi:Zinc finger, ZZ type